MRIHSRSLSSNEDSDEYIDQNGLTENEILMQRNRSQMNENFLNRNLDSINKTAKRENKQSSILQFAKKPDTPINYKAYLHTFLNRVKQILFYIIHISFCNIKMNFDLFCMPDKKFIRFLILFIYQESEELDVIRNRRAKEKTPVDVLLPYSLGKLDSFYQRLIFTKIYKPKMNVVSIFLFSQLRSRTWNFTHTNFLFLAMIIYYFYVFVNEGFPYSFLLNLIPNIGCSIFSHLKNFYFSCVFDSFLHFFFTSPVSSNSELIFIFTVLLLSVYFSALDLFKLEKLYIERHVHTLFSPATYIIFSYFYLFVCAFPFYLIFLFIFKCYYLLVLLPFAVVFIVLICTYSCSTINFLIILLVSILCLVFGDTFDKISDMSVYGSNSSLNPISVIYRICLGFYGEKIYTADVFACLLIMLLFYVASVYRLSKWSCLL